MRRIMLTVAYDGTEYAGFQRQPGEVRTVEGELDAAVSSVTGESIEVIGASRTDAGVHARGNIAVFDTNSRIPAERFARAVNTRLPEDIRAVGSREVPGDFHPRHAATEKTYEYRIVNAEYPDPLRRRYAHYSYTLFNVDAMKAAALYFIGEHDFRSFCSIYTQSLTTVRTITEIDVAASADAMPREIVITVTGTGFLYNMVRIIAGTLMEVGRGAIAPERIPEIIAARDRRAAGPTAPPQGLTLAGYRFIGGIPDPAAVEFSEEVKTD